MKPVGAFFIFVLVVFGCAGSKPPLETVESVDLKRYLGKWYEIASYLPGFKKDVPVQQPKTAS